MFLRCFLMLSLLVGLRTAEASIIDKNLGKHQDPLYGTLECPEYRLVKMYSSFEHREYDASQWISTSVIFDGGGTNAGFRSLSQYMNGSNSAGARLTVTSPLVFIFPIGNKDDKTVTMSMFLSANLKNPPMPLKSTIYIQRYPKSSVYVKSFTGKAKDEYSKNIKALAEELNGLGLAFNHSFFACTTYLTPSKQINHHVEVWLLAGAAQE